MRGLRMPMALCSVDLGRMRALRISEAMRAAAASRVKASAQRASEGANAGSHAAASAVASVKPDAQPSNV